MQCLLCVTCRYTITAQVASCILVTRGFTVTPAHQMGILVAALVLFGALNLASVRVTAFMTSLATM